MNRRRIVTAEQWQCNSRIVLSRLVGVCSEQAPVVADASSLDETPRTCRFLTHAEIAHVLHDAHHFDGRLLTSDLLRTSVRHTASICQAAFTCVGPGGPSGLSPGLPQIQTCTR